MKRLAIVLVCVLAASMLFPCIAVRAEPSFVPHEDPAAAQSVMDAYSFLSQYAEILALVSSKEYANASRLTEQLSHITVPEDLSYIINRYNNLTSQLIGALSELQTTLDNASSLLNQYRLDEAAVELDSAGVLVARAVILLGDLEDATATLSQRLGVFAASAGSKVRQAYDTLQSLLQRLNDLVNQYHTLLQSIRKQEEDIKAEQLDPTALTLNLNATNVFVGGAVGASGVLTSKGSNLQNREVVLLLDGVQVASATTSATGAFFAIVRIPFIYVHAMAAQALYVPSGSDRGVYLAALSPTVSISVVFFDTELNVTIPDVAYPGLPLTVSGTVASQDGTLLNARKVGVVLDEGLLGELQSDSSGFFTLQTVVSPQTTTGLHNLTFTVKPEGSYAGTSQQRKLSIKKMVSTVNVQAPSFVLFPSEVRVTGTASSASGPLKNARVTLEFASISVVSGTLGDGTFSLTMNLPLNTVIGGFQSLKVTVEPEESWQASAQVMSDIFVLNSVSIGLVSASSVSVAAVVYARFAKSKPRKEERVARVSQSLTSLQGSSVEVALPSKPEFRFEGVRGKVLAAYLKALRSVESVTGFVLKSEMTLREFLYEAEPRLGDAANPFAELTILSERTLYSPHLPREQDVSKAEEFAGEIGRMLKR